MLPLTTFYRSGAPRSDVYKWDAFVTSWRFYNRAWQPQRHDRPPETSGTLWIHRGALTNQRCSLATGCGIKHAIILNEFQTQQRACLKDSFELSKFHVCVCVRKMIYFLRKSVVEEGNPVNCIQWKKIIKRWSSIQFGTHFSFFFAERRRILWAILELRQMYLLIMLPHCSLFEGAS